MTLPPGTPDLAVLDLLVSVADTGSLGAAARRHGISQPAASMRISALERRLRLRLLDRGPTGSVLTEAGRVAVEPAREVRAAARSLTATRTARGLDRPPGRGIVGVAVTGTGAGQDRQRAGAVLAAGGLRRGAPERGVRGAVNARAGGTPSGACSTASRPASVSTEPVG
ncbi:LysR family transcriptional regulator, partial [Nocardia farcinica]|uniref:LysR family transcriptional regulator n=1 Tax=Nocardia farcinica TaxID=37329 RepID=UPI00245395F3